MIIIKMKIKKAKIIRKIIRKAIIRIIKILVIMIKNEK